MVTRPARTHCAGRQPQTANPTTPGTQYTHTQYPIPAQPVLKTGAGQPWPSSSAGSCSSSSGTTPVSPSAPAPQWATNSRSYRFTTIPPHPQTPTRNELVPVFVGAARERFLEPHQPSSPYGGFFKMPDSSGRSQYFDGAELEEPCNRCHSISC